MSQSIPGSVNPACGVPGSQLLRSRLLSFLRGPCTLLKVKVASPRTSALALLLVTALVLAACGDDAGGVTTTTAAVTTTVDPTTTTEPGATTTTEPIGPRNEYGGEVVIGELDEPLSLNPFFTGGGGSAERIGQAYFAGVADVDGFTLELVPDVVVELPSVANRGLVVNGDGTETVTFVIDPRAVWADGTPISGADFEFTYETIMDPLLGLDQSGYDDIDPLSVVVSDKTFRFTLARPSLAVETMFGVLLPAHEVAGTDLLADWNDRMWVSGGPFELEEWSRGEFLTLRRNPAYWKVDPETGQQLPYLDRVVFRFVADVETLVAEFSERRLDVITPGMDPEVLAELSGLVGVVVDVVGGGQWEHLSFQFGDGRLERNPGSYNAHLEFRRAVAEALDRDALATAVFGDAWDEGLDSYVEAFTPGWSGEAWAAYDYDPAAARTSLDELCAKEGVDCVANPPKVVFTTTEQRIELAEALEPMFTAAGIEFEMELEPRVVFLGETIEYGRFDVGVWSWAGGPGLHRLVCAHRFWDPRQAPPNGNNHYRYGSPAYSGVGEFVSYQEGPSAVIDEHTARMEELATLMGVDQGCHPATVDQAELLGLVTEAEALLAEQVVFIPLYQLPEVGVVWADEIAGYRHNPTGGGDTWNIAYWHRIDS